MTKISLLPNTLDPTTVNDKTKIELPVVDTQINPPGSGDNFKAGFDAIQYVVTNEMITSIAHGLTAADKGKPLFGISVVNDTAADEYGMWLMLGYVDADNFRIVPPGTAMDIPVAMIEDNAAYDVTVKGYELFWDASANMYVSVQPPDSSQPPAINVISVGSTTFRAVLLPPTSADVQMPSAVEITVKGTGTPATDNTLLQAAKTALNAAGGGILWIDGTVKVSAQVAFTTAVSVFGVPGTAPTLEYQENAGYFSWNGTYNGITEVQSGTAITATLAFASEVIVPQGLLVQGDWFLVSSNDAVTGNTRSPAYTGGHRTIEMHQVKEVRTNTGGNDYIIFDDYIRDPLTTSPKIKKVTVLRDIEVKGLTFTWVGSTGSPFPSLDFRACVNVRVHGCHWANDGPNEALFMYCGNCRVYDIVAESCRMYDEGEGYAIVVGTVNGFTFSDSVCYGHRHVFTTTGQALSLVRYGTSRNTVISNVSSRGNGAAASSLVAFDTHEGGWEILFEGCHATVPYERQSYPGGAKSSNRGFQSRSRGTIFKSCTVDCRSGSVNGFLIQAEDNRIEDCSVHGGWKAVEIKYDTSGGVTTGVDRCTVSNLKHINANDNAGILAVITAGDDHQIIHSSIAGNPATAGARAGIDISDSGDDAPTVSISHCKFSRIRGAGILISSTGCSAKASFCDFDDVGRTATYEESCIHIEGTSTLEVNYSDLSKTANVYSVSGTAYTDSQIDGVGNNFRGYTGGGLTTIAGIESANTDATDITNKLTGKNWIEDFGAGAGGATGYDLSTTWCAADGVTDDTQNLRDAIANSGDELYLRAGVYIVSDTIVIPKNKKVYGAGNATIIRGSQTGGKPIFDIGRQGAFTTTDAGDLVNATGHLLEEGWTVQFYEFNGGSPTGQTPPGGLGQGTTYYVRNPNANDFQVSTTPTGSIFDITAAAGSGSSRRFWHNAGNSDLHALRVEGTSASQVAIGIRTESSSRFTLEDVRVSSIGTGVSLGYQGTDIPPWGSWLLDIRNLWVTNCSTVCLQAKNVNGAKVHATLENSVTTARYFDINSCSGSTFFLHAEGAFQSATSKIDNCEGSSFDGSWFEYLAGTNVNREIPFLTIGGTTINKNLSMKGISLYGGNDLRTGILIDRIDGLEITGNANLAGNGNEVRYTSNAINVEDRLVCSAGQGANTHRYGAPVEITQLPVQNLYRDPFFDEGLPLHLIPNDGSHRVQLSAVTLDATTVLPGKYRSIKVTANSGQANARLIFELPLEGELERLKGKVATVGIWWYAPSTYYDIITEPAVYPFCKLLTDGTGPLTTVNYQKSQHISDNWTFACWETSNGSKVTTPIPSDATFLKLDVWLQSTGSPLTVAGQHLFIGGIVVAPGGAAMMERYKKGTISQLSERRNNFIATSVPGTSDNYTKNYGPGSLWLNTSTDTAYICVDIDSGTGNATWTAIT